MKQRAPISRPSRASCRVAREGESAPLRGAVKHHLMGAAFPPTATGFMLEVSLSVHPRGDMPAFDAQSDDVGPGRFFARHPAVYRLSLAGSSGASAYALMRARSPRAGGRPLWAAMALLEAGITVGIIRVRKAAV